MINMLHHNNTGMLKPHLLSIIGVVLLAISCEASDAASTVSPSIYQRNTRLTGMTRARVEMIVSSEVSGKCEKVYADVGEQIPQSGQFALIDSTFIDLDIKSNILEQQKLKRQLENEYVTLQRYTQLKKTNATTQAKFDEVRLNADIHKIELDNLSNRQSRLKEMRQRYTITAQPGWHVIERMIEPGELVQPGQKLARIGDFSQLVVSFSLSFKQLQALKQSPSTLLLIPDNQMTLPARLHTVSPSYDQKTRKVPVELILENKQKDDYQAIRGGMRAELSLAVADNDHTFELPGSAVISKYDTHWVIREDGTKLQVILLGTSEKDSAIISSPDLSEQDILLTNPVANF